MEEECATYDSCMEGKTHSSGLAGMEFGWQTAVLRSVLQGKGRAQPAVQSSAAPYPKPLSKNASSCLEADLTLYCYGSFDFSYLTTGWHNGTSNEIAHCFCCQIGKQWAHVFLLLQGFSTLVLDKIMPAIFRLDSLHISSDLVWRRGKPTSHLTIQVQWGHSNNVWADT